MKAAVVKRPYELAVEEVDKPKIKEEEVLIEVKASGFCGSDLHIFEGKSNRVKYPLIIGHEASGIVVGSKNDHIENINKNVLIYPIIGCNKCKYCRLGSYHLCTKSKAIGFELNGSHAEFVSIPYKNLIPTNLDFSKASPLACAGLTVYSAFKNYALNYVNREDYVLIVGVGGLGHIAIQLLKHITPNIIAIDKDDDKLSFAKRLGAMYTLTKSSSADEIVKITEGGVKIAFDFVGNDETLTLCFESLCQQGRLVIIGAGGGTARYTGPDFKRREIVSSVVGSIEELRELVNLVENNKLQVLTQSYSLDEIHDVLGLIKSGKILGRAVLEI